VFCCLENTTLPDLAHHPGQIAECPPPAPSVQHCTKLKISLFFPILSSLSRLARARDIQMANVKKRT